MLEKIKRPVLLVLLDGYGVAPESEDNLIKKNLTKNFNFLTSEYPAMNLYSSGRQIGLSEDEPGNSIAGHINMGAGRLCYSTKEKINKAITDKTFFENKNLLKMVDFVKDNQSNLHLLGFLGLEKNFSDEKHLLAALELCRRNKLKNVYLHIFLDTENTMDENNKKILKDFLIKIKQYNFVKISSLSGKYFAMDMDMHWDRTEQVYKTICDDESSRVFFLEKILNDFSILDLGPVRINGQYSFEEKDALFFFNHSSVGMRQLVKTFALPNFSKFSLKFNHQNNLVITLTEYEKELPVLVAFPKFFIYNSLSEILSKNHLKQYHIASAEGFAEATYYFNGKNSMPFEDETDEMIKASSSEEYAVYLEKISKKITNKVIKNINNDNFDFYLINYSALNLAVDFIKDKEVFDKIVSLLDKQISKLADYCLAKDGTLFITSSYSKKELIGPSNSRQVPFLIVKNNLRGKKAVLSDSINDDLSLVQPVGNLSDIAPTILDELDIEIPKEMTGKSLLN